MPTYDETIKNYREKPLPAIASQQAFQQEIIGTLRSDASDDAKHTKIERLFLLGTYTPPQDGSKGASLAALHNRDIGFIETLASMGNINGLANVQSTSGITTEVSTQTLPNNSGRGDGRKI